MNWFYSKGGQQLGPVAFSEIERLRAAGELDGETLVWQEGSPAWVKLSSLPGSAPVAPEIPAPAPSPSFGAAPVAPSVADSPFGAPVAPAPAFGSPALATPLPDYGKFLTWGIFIILIPCLNWIGLIALIVLHCMEYFAARKEVEAGRLKSTTYSEMHPALFIAGLVCCSLIAYPVFMHLREKSGYFSPQPKAVMISIIAIVSFFVIYIGLNLVLNLGAVAAGGLHN